MATLYFDAAAHYNNRVRSQQSIYNEKTHELRRARKLVKSANTKAPLVLLQAQEQLAPRERLQGQLDPRKQAQLLAREPQERLPV